VLNPTFFLSSSMITALPSFLDQDIEILEEKM
jgi:hypothetical protein